MKYNFLRKRSGDPLGGFLQIASANTVPHLKAFSLRQPVILSRSNTHSLAVQDLQNQFTPLSQNSVWPRKLQSVQNSSVIEPGPANYQAAGPNGTISRSAPHGPQLFSAACHSGLDGNLPTPESISNPQPIAAAAPTATARAAARPPHSSSTRHAMHHTPQNAPGSIGSRTALCPRYSRVRPTGRDRRSFNRGNIAQPNSDAEPRHYLQAASLENPE